MGTMPFQDYMQFINICDQISLEDRAKMAEFYLHNMALTVVNVLDPNAKLGYLQLMALVAWMNHEESKPIEMKGILAREQNESLFIRAKQ